MPSDPLLTAFDRTVRRAPGAAVAVSPAHRVTLGDVDALARAAARALSAGGASPEPGEPVAFQAANGPGFLAGFLALLRAGCPPLLLDRTTPEPERRRLAAEMGARFALVCRCGWAGGGDDFRLEAVTADRPAVEVPTGTGVIKLSSATTGSARGIATPVEALLEDDRRLTATMGIRGDDRLLATVPFSHSYGLSSLVVPALVRGTPLVLPASDDPFAPITAAADAGATVFPTVPAYLAALNRLAEPPPLPPSLRLVITAGALLPATTSARFRERFGRSVHGFYGASECGGICYDREGGAAERGTVGAPVDGVQVDLVPVNGGGGADASDPCAAGETRVVVRSPAVALGYLPPEPERLGPHPDGGPAFYRTDDLAEWRDGELALLGRLNDLINVRGKKVNPREVERVLRDLAAVRDVVVTAAPAPDGGGQRVRAAIACDPGSLDTEAVIAFARDRLADHKVPRSVVLVDELPRTERGKVDRAAVTRLAPGGGRPTALAGRTD